MGIYTNNSKKVLTHPFVTYLLIGIYMPTVSGTRDTVGSKHCPEEFSKKGK